MKGIYVGFAGLKDEWGNHHKIGCIDRSAYYINTEDYIEKVDSPKLYHYVENVQ